MKIFLSFIFYAEMQLIYKVNSIKKKIRLFIFHTIATLCVNLLNILKGHKSIDLQPFRISIIRIFLHYYTRTTFQQPDHTGYSFTVAGVRRSV